jgi:putative hemolysin
MDSKENIIDVQKAIRSSKSRFVRSLPHFIIVLIEKLIHQDEMNETINKFSHETGIPFVNDVLKDWNVEVVVKGGENVPSSGRFVFVANHPVGGIDALGFLSTIHRFFPNVISPSNQLFNYIPNLHPVILGVNVFGTNTKNTVEKFNQLFESDSQIMIFPAGLVSRRSRGVISDHEWQKTFITKAIQFKRDIIPVHISGRNSNLFYGVDKIRKLLGIKMSVEIILLPLEMHRQKNKPITFSIGKVIPYQTFNNSISHLEWAQKVKETVYSIQL